MIKLQTHQSANSAEYQSGCPGEWPRVEIDVEDKYKLTQKELDAGFILETKEQWTTRIATYKQQYETWLNNYQNQKDTINREAIRDVYQSLKLIENSEGNLSAAQLSNAVRLFSRVLLKLIHTLDS